MTRTYHITYDTFKRNYRVIAKWPGPDGETMTFCASTHATLDRAKRAALAYRRADEARQDKPENN